MASTGSPRGRLPLELMQYIVDDLERANAKRTLASLAAASRPLHALAVPALYRRMVLTRVNIARVLGLPPRSPSNAGSDGDAEEKEREYDARDARWGDALGPSVGAHLAAQAAEHVYSQRFRLPVDLAPTGPETDDERAAPASPRATPNRNLRHVRHLTLAQWPAPALVAAVASAPRVLFPNAERFAVGPRAVARCPQLHAAAAHGFLTRLARAPAVCVACPPSEAGADTDTGRLEWVVGCLFSAEYAPASLAVHDCPARPALAAVLGTAGAFGWLSDVTLYLPPLAGAPPEEQFRRHSARFAFLRAAAEETRPRVPGRAARLAVCGVADAPGRDRWGNVLREEQDGASVPEMEAWLDAHDGWADGARVGAHAFLPADADAYLAEQLEAARDHARTLTRRVARLERRLNTTPDESAVAAAEAALARAHEEHRAALAELDASDASTPKPEMGRLRDARHAAAVAVGMASKALKAVKAEADRRAILARHDAGLKYLLEELHAAEDAAGAARAAFEKDRREKRKLRLEGEPFPCGRIRLSAAPCGVCGGETFGRRSLRQIIDDAWASSAT